MEININNKYKEITCPVCDKSHFRVKSHNTDFGFDIFPAIFTYHEDPIYKNGVLQNPEPIKSVEERFECKECGCNFRVEHINGNISKITNEDAEKSILEELIGKHNEEVKKQRKNEQPIEGVKINDKDASLMDGITNLDLDTDYCITSTVDSGLTTLSFGTYNDIENFRPEIEEIKENINKILERLELLEKK